MKLYSCPFLLLISLSYSKLQWVSNKELEKQAEVFYSKSESVMGLNANKFTIDQ